MTPDVGRPPLRVEQALRLLPDIDALMPLRPVLIAASHTPTAEPSWTIGKRHLDIDALRDALPRAVDRVTTHLEVLYHAALDALEAEQRGDAAAVVDALVRAGDRERDTGRDTPADAWYERALRVAEELRERGPEVAALLRMGDHAERRGHFEQSARHHQRALALAEAERDLHGAACACRGLGRVALVQGRSSGAESWLTRGLRFAAADRGLSAGLHVDLAELFRLRGAVEQAADHAGWATTVFDELGDAEGAVLAQHAWGLIETARGRFAEALHHFKTALERLARLADRRTPRHEMTVRLDLCRLYLAWGRFPDLEDEARRAEEIAVAGNLGRHLARLYGVIGAARGRRGDEEGFVFFEKALELCRGIEPAPRLEAEVYVEYAAFRDGLGDREEARACLERAQEILQMLGNGPMLAAVERALAESPPGI